MDPMIYVCVYCDSTGLYTEEECDFDNMTYLQFPESIVKEWFDFKGYGKFTEFHRWLSDEYTCDDTDGLYQFALDRGFHVKRED